MLSLSIPLAAAFSDLFSKVHLVASRATFFGVTAVAAAVAAGAVAVTAAGSADPRLARSCLHSDGTRITTNSNIFVAATPVPPPIAASSRIYLRGALFDSLREDIEVPTFMDGGTAKLSNDLSGIW